MKPSFPYCNIYVTQKDTIFHYNHHRVFFFLTEIEFQRRFESINNQSHERLEGAECILRQVNVKQVSN